ncbi:acyl-CoA desaturase [Urbifossiella limnaea]|uniref:Fatty acid desaturase n=1 Tax=Urbifossiella limnaea TaxID=2528023 RepID=A0A517Y3E3_9BACT|nr:fatty acid desaturase [Urbifossiella limnaea]QDU24269.1 Fatty acid desaturase [Urbifossiella limnaea]
MSAVVPATAAVGPAAPRPRPKLIRGFYVMLIVVHLLALTALLPYVFTWWGVVALLVGNFVFGSIGINLAYHRMLTHDAVQFPTWLRRVFITCGVCSLEGSPLWWVLNHRIHHQKSDAAGDPHSPRDGFFWGHMGWIYTSDAERNRLSTYEKYVPDLMTDPYLRWLHRGQRWTLVYLAHALVIAAVGFAVGFAVTDTTEAAVQLGTQVFVWGVLVRTVYVWHITWFVNSAAHRWGYKSYDTPDNSRNNWWVALLTNGEGWHNNHHAAPRACSQGHRWWEIDLTFTFVRALALVGLATNVVPVKVAGYRQKDATA